MWYNIFCHVSDFHIGRFRFSEPLTPQIEYLWANRPFSIGINPLVACVATAAIEKGRFVMLKRCSKCGIEKLVDQFSKDKSGKSDLRSSCKQCAGEYHYKWYRTFNGQQRTKERSREWRAIHKEEDNQRSKKWSRHHPESRRETVRKYRERNIEKCRKNSKKWYIENRDARKEKVKKYVILPRQTPIIWSKLEHPGTLGASLLVS